MIAEHQKRRYLRPAVLWAIFAEPGSAERSRDGLLEAGFAERDVILVPAPSEDELRVMSEHPTIPQELKPGQAALVVKLASGDRETAARILQANGAGEVRFSEAVALEERADKVEEFAQRQEELEERLEEEET